MNNPLVQPDPGLYIWTIVTFLILRLLLLFLDGPSTFDVWLSDHIRQPHPSEGLKIVERLAGAPGSVKGAAALIFVVINFIVDVLYAAIDPRLRAERAAVGR